MTLNAQSHPNNWQEIESAIGTMRDTDKEFPTTNVFMKNSSAKFGDNVDVNTEVILIPNQRLHGLPVMASKLIDSKKLRSAETANPPILQGGLSSSYLTKRVGTCIGVFSLLVIYCVTLIVFLQGDNKSGDFVSRKDWGAKPATCPVEDLKIVPNLVIIHHTGDPGVPCATLIDCKNTLKSIQRYHTHVKPFCDIGYNFLIGGDGKIYEGRGYTAQGAHTPSKNAVSLGFAFIGDFENDHPPEQHLKFALDFLENTARLGYLTNDFKICGRNQLSANLSPGKKLSEDIQQWPRYTADPQGWLDHTSGKTFAT